MSKDAPEENNARYAVDASKEKKGRKWFEQAAKLVDQRNYDYAIKSFTEGLSHNPDAVEEGYVPLRGCAIARWQTGGKKPGTMDGVKHSMTTRDAVKGLLNATWLFAHDPTNSGYAEGILRNANKAHCENTVFWIGPIYRELIGGEKKPNPKKFALLKETYEELGDRCQARGEVDEAVKAYELGIEAVTSQRVLDNKNRDLDTVLRELSTKLTIVKGQYDSAESFVDSLRNSGEQSKLHDEDRLVQSEERLNELIEQARLLIEANPGEDAKVIAYVDLLCKNEKDENEKTAMRLLTERYQQSDNYRFKQRADDIAMRQLGRRARLAKKSGDNDRYKELTIRRLKYEEKVFSERIKKYPTDLKLKYEYGKRLFQVRKFDEAIPMFQQARTDTKVRTTCSIYLGRCFFERNLYDQAIEVLTDAIEQYELGDDDVAKELNYWLARSLEAADRPAEAKKAYGKLMQIDYNYRDIRKRMEAIVV